MTIPVTPVVRLDGTLVSLDQVVSLRPVALDPEQNIPMFPNEKPYQVIFILPQVGGGIAEVKDVWILTENNAMRIHKMIEQREVIEARRARPVITTSREKPVDKTPDAPEEKTEDATSEDATGDVNEDETKDLTDEEKDEIANDND